MFIMKVATTHWHYNHYYYSCSFLFLWMAMAAAAAVRCERKCGDVDVPYPFGIDDPSCAKADARWNFTLECNRAYSPPTVFLEPGIEVINISLEDATMSVRIHNSFTCYNESGSIPNQTFSQSITLGSIFTFNTVENKLVGLGCDTLAYMGDGDGKFGSGCISLCNEDVNLTAEGSCSGFGCCQTSVPKNVKTLGISLLTSGNHVGILGFNPCDFALLVDMRTFNISAMRLGFQPKDPAVEKASVLLDWVVGTEECEEAKTNQTSYACAEELTFVKVVGCFGKFFTAEDSYSLVL